jgi:hypothetical protein
MELNADRGVPQIETFIDIDVVFISKSSRKQV